MKAINRTGIVKKMIGVVLAAGMLYGNVDTVVPVLAEETVIQQPEIHLCTSDNEIGSKQLETILKARTSTNWGIYAYIYNINAEVIGETGIMLYDESGSLLASKTETYLESSNRLKNAPCWYTVNEELGVVLQPETTYQYRIYAYVGEQRLESPMGSFTTYPEGTETISADIISGAVEWGNRQIGYTGYDQDGLDFVRDCFKNGGYETEVSFAGVTACGDELITADKDTENIPKGAVVFLEGEASESEHMGICLGDGTMLHIGASGVEVLDFRNAQALMENYQMSFRGWGVWGSKKGNKLDFSSEQMEKPSITVCEAEGDIEEGHRQRVMEARTCTNWCCYAYINNSNKQVIGEVGILLYDNTGKLLGKKTETYLESMNQMKNAPVWYTVNEELGVLLEQGTTYKYQFYAYVGGTRIESAVETFTTKGEAKQSLGDLNGDGGITLEDAQLALKAALRIDSLTEAQTQAADVNEDEKLSLEDAQIILKAALKLAKIEDYAKTE